MGWELLGIHGFGTGRLDFGLTVQSDFGLTFLLFLFLCLYCLGGLLYLYHIDHQRMGLIGPKFSVRTMLLLGTSEYCAELPSDTGIIGT